MILAIDFDGVLHDQKNPVEGRKMGRPVEGAYAAMVQLKVQGHTLIVHSVWGGPAMAEWLRFYQIPYDEITSTKPKADFYIDDKAIKFTSWEDTLKCLTN
jgi:hypothetical protein